MKLSELKTKLCARVLYMPDPEREADGGYCGAPSCRAFAEDVAAKEVSKDECVRYEK